MLRKDLSQIGSLGVRGVGYDTAVLTDQLVSVLGRDEVRPVVIVGMGRLGQALASHGGFDGDGFDEPRRAAELVMQCVISSGLYPYFTGREAVWSKAVTVDGRPGWSIRAEIRVD